MKKYIIYTNTILRYLLNDNIEMFKEARYFFDLIKLGKARAYLEQAVFAETIGVLSKVYKVPKEEIAKVLKNLLMYKGILNAEKEVLIKALEVYAENELQITESLIIAKASLMGLETSILDEALRALNATK